MGVTDEDRLKAARARAAYELGDPEWADIIIRAYTHPAEDTAALLMEME